MKLYSYFRSSAAYRVRIAFNLKGLSYETVPIHLQKEGGQNLKPEYRAINPQMRVPTLELDSGELLTQSLAIIEYLDEVHPHPPLLPRDPVDARQGARAGADSSPATSIRSIISARCAISRTSSGHDQAKIDAWYHHWVLGGFEALETMVRPGPYAFGTDVTLADICLVPQVANARRLKVPLDRFPKIVAIDAACAQACRLRQGAAGKPAGCGIGRARIP